MVLTKEDTIRAKGAAVLGMVMLHLFCRLGTLPYVPLIWFGDTPLIYYLGLFGDLCVPVFCFCSGYAHYLLREKKEAQYAKEIPNKILRLMVNFWIVLVLFTVLGFLFDESGQIPGSMGAFLGNAFLYRLSYNGAWWFLLTYLFLLVLSPILYRITKTLNGFCLLAISGCVYFLSYLFRFKWMLEISHPVIGWLWQQMILLGTSQFSYILGMLAFRYEIPQRLRAYFAAGSHRLAGICLGILLPLLAFLLHCMVPSLVIAPVTAMSVLLSLTLLNLPVWLKGSLEFLGKHSTNIWLVHMFFYMNIFKGLVFLARYPILILLLMMGLCIAVSYPIQWLERQIFRK